METVRELVPLVIQGSLFLMLLAIGLECRWDEIRHVRRAPGALAKSVVAVYVAVPLAAIAVVAAMPIDPVVATALLLMAVSPLAPLVPGRALKVGADRAVVVTTFVILILLAIVLMPVTLAIVGWVFHREVVIPGAAIVRLVLVFTVLPLVAGLAIRALMPKVAELASPLFMLLSNIVLALFVVAVLWVAGAELWALVGDGTILAFTLVTGAAIAAGHMLGGPDWNNRGALAMATAIRHPGLAVILAHSNNADKRVVVAVLLFLLNGVVLTTLYQVWLKRARPNREPEPGR